MVAFWYCSLLAFRPLSVQFEPTHLTVSLCEMDFLSIGGRLTLRRKEKDRELEGAEMRKSDDLTIGKRLEQKTRWTSRTQIKEVTVMGDKVEMR